MGAFAHRSSCVSVGCFDSAVALLFITASCAFIDRNPPFFAFSSCFYSPKSIYEGNFGCGYLKERRASGLVFCENTTSVYRALFVSSSVFFLPFVLMETARMWAGTSNAINALVEWCGMLFKLSCMISVTVRVFLLCLFCKSNTAVANFGDCI